jgi:hypothetical protein
LHFHDPLVDRCPVPPHPFRNDKKKIEQQRYDMGHQSSFHAPEGGVFLGLRQGRSGASEIVYDDGVARRLIWRVSSTDSRPEDIDAALRVAVGNVRVVPTLYAELKKRSIAIEAVIR